MTSAAERPADTLVSLVEAFAALGRHLYPDAWTGEEAVAIRLGQRSKVNRAVWDRGVDVLQEMTRCVQNGWLPLVYFDRHGRRTWYFANSDGYALTALYPLPEHDEPGQIELASGDSFPCMVDVGGFDKLIAAKYPRTKATSREKKHLAFERAARRYYEANPDQGDKPLPRQVVAWIRAEGKLKEPDWPPESTRYRLIDQGRIEVRGRLNSHQPAHVPMRENRPLEA